MLRRTTCLVALLVPLAACRPADRMAVPSAAPPAHVESRPEPAPLLEPWLAALNLSFEGEELGPWQSSGGEMSLSAEARVGARSLRLVTRKGTGAAVGQLPIERVRDRRVRLGGWIRTADVTEEAGLWIRVDGPGGSLLDLANMTGRGPKGSTEWRRYEIEIDVPPEATQVAFGAFVAGAGEAWFDGLEVSLRPYVPPRQVTVTGVVLGEDGAPVPNALVAGVARDRHPTVTRAGADGRFTLELRMGSWAFTATAPQGAAYLPPSDFRDEGEVTLRLVGGDLTLRGTVSLVGARPPALRVVAMRLSDDTGDSFVAAVDEQGRFALRLPEAKGYVLTFWGEGIFGDSREVPGRGDQQVALNASVPGPPPESVVAWIRRSAAPLASVTAGADLADMKPWRELTRGVRIVALGEATHGTREFFQMKHRTLEYLVLREGFTLFAIEANLTEARAVNDYVLHGRSDPAVALAGLYFWTWNTEEVLGMIEWMRTYNADPAHKEKVQFFGFDMQTTAVAWKNVAAFLVRLDPAAAPPAELEVFAARRLEGAWQGLSADERKARRAAIDGIVARLDRERDAIIARTDALAWRHAREDARLVAQAAEMADAPDERAKFEVRDRAMAENVTWLLGQEARSGKMVLWGHNGHISRGWPPLVNMGAHLHKAYGRRYLGVGFAFAEGSFQAIGSKGALGEFTVGPPSEADLSTAFTRAGCERCFLDLRRAPRGEVSDWLHADQPMRDIGAFFPSEDGMTRPVRLAERYDVLFFIHKTTRARPQPSALK